MTNDIRWQQRFHNYEKAFLLLERALTIATPSEVERGGIIQFYEMAFELAWKLMKDYLEQLGYTVNSPRDAIKQAFQANILDDGQRWMDALGDRNLLRILMMKTRPSKWLPKSDPIIFRLYSSCIAA